MKTAIKECLMLWEWLKNESIKEFNKTYELLGVTNFDSYHGEAFIMIKWIRLSMN